MNYYLPISVLSVAAQPVAILIPDIQCCSFVYNNNKSGGGKERVGSEFLAQQHAKQCIRTLLLTI